MRRLVENQELGKMAKRILVTGGNKGIGLAIVTKLLQDYPDTYLILGSRDVRRGQAAVAQINELMSDSCYRLELLQLDVTSDESVKAAVELLKAKYEEDEPLYGLVNNAGGFSDSARGTVELNTYGLRRVCEAFLPLIQKNKGMIIDLSTHCFLILIFRPNSANFFWCCFHVCCKMQQKSSGAVGQPKCFLVGH